MARYIVLYHAPESWETKTGVTPEDMQKGMEAWMAWAQRCGDGLVDEGTPLKSGGKRIAKSGTAPSDSDIRGYSILEAENMDAAQALLVDHPHLDWAAGYEIEVQEAMSMPG